MLFLINEQGLGPSDLIDQFKRISYCSSELKVICCTQTEEVVQKKKKMASPGFEPETFSVLD